MFKGTAANGTDSEGTAEVLISCSDDSDITCNNPTHAIVICFDNEENQKL